MNKFGDNRKVSTRAIVAGVVLVGVVGVLAVVISKSTGKEKEPSSPISSVTVVDYPTTSAGTDSESSLDAINQQIANDNAELGINTSTDSGEDTSSEFYDVKDVVDARGKNNVDGVLYQFADSIQSSAFDMSWYSDKSESELDTDNSETMVIDADTCDYDRIVTMVASSDCEDDTIILENLTFVTYLDEGMSMALCEVNPTNSIESNLVIAIDVYGDAGYAYGSGDKVVYAGDVRNIKVTSIKNTGVSEGDSQSASETDVEVLVLGYSSNPNR